MPNKSPPQRRPVRGSKGTGSKGTLQNTPQINNLTDKAATILRYTGSEEREKPETTTPALVGATGWHP